MSNTSNPSTGSTTIFVGNLSSQLTPDLLHATFSSFGQIDQIQIPVDAQKKITRNFGFITFNSKLSAYHAIDNMNLNRISADPEQKILKVNLARANYGGKRGTVLATDGKEASGNDQDDGQGHFHHRLNSHRPVWDDENWIKQHALKEEEPQPGAKDQGATDS